MAYYDPMMALQQGYPPAVGNTSIGDLFSGQGDASRNFLALLAGIGARLDPQGAGGAIGVPAQQAIASIAAQDRAKAQAAAQNAQTKMVIEALNQHGGISPKENPGVTSIKATPEGVQFEVTPKQDTTGLEAPSPTAAPAVAAPAGTSVPAAPTVPSLGVGPEGVRPYSATRERINSLLPFYSTLLGAQTRDPWQGYPQSR